MNLTKEFKSLKNCDFVIGVDEAGRGPVLGMKLPSTSIALAKRS